MTNQPIDRNTISRIKNYVDEKERTVESTFKILFHRAPKWIPEPTLSRTKRIIEKLLVQELSAETIRTKMLEASRDALIFPGTITDPVAFSQDIYELTSLKLAIAQGKEKGLQAIAGEQAAHGQKFMNGRQAGSINAVRKLIRESLVKNPLLTNEQLWGEMNNLPKGYYVHDTKHSGKYIDYPNAGYMHYPRFRNVCSEERRKLKLSRFSEA